MADQFDLGLYTGTVTEALLCEGTKTDKDTGMDVAYQYVNVKVALNTHHSKTGTDTPLEAEPVVNVFKSLSGGCLEGKGLEITMKQLKALGGQLFDEQGMDAFLPPNNGKLVGSTIQVMCSVNERKPQYRNWEIYSPGSAAPKTPASKQASSALNAKLGIKPVVKKAVVQKPAADAPVAETFV